MKWRLKMENDDDITSNKKKFWWEEAFLTNNFGHLFCVFTIEFGSKSVQGQYWGLWDSNCRSLLLKATTLPAVQLNEYFQQRSARFTSSKWLCRFSESEGDGGPYLSGLVIGIVIQEQREREHFCWWLCKLD